MSSDGEPLAPGAIRLRNVSKAYDRAGRKRWTTAIPGHVAPLRRRMLALDDISFDIEPGESVGLIGANGAGKSTLLKLLAGVVDATEGAVDCVGRVGSMIELGLGFHDDLTGRENAMVTATLLGLSPADAARQIPSIIDFAGIADAMDTPLKHYSTGMRARLGFAVAIHVPHDVLLIDEVLAVGDSEFQLRCVEKIDELNQAGTTLVFVSHATYLVSSVCKRVMQLRKGRVVDDGPAVDVIQRYLMPAPGDLGMAERPTMHLRSFTMDTPRVKPFDQLEFSAEVEITEPINEPSIAVDLAWATIAPETPIARNSTALPVELRTPGTYRIKGRSTKLPVDSGHAEVRVAVIDETAQRVHDRLRAELWIEGPITRQHPQLAAELQWDLHAVAAIQATPGATSRETTRAAAVRTGDTSVPPAIECHQVTKRFQAGLRRGGIAGALPSHLAEREADGDVKALDHLDLVVTPGQCLGVIGPNGSGKSTLLKVLAQVMAPTSGDVISRGRLVSMLELGIGFHNDLTGLENVRHTAGLFGFTKPEIDAMLPGVIEFAEIGDAIEAPVKQYSSGMMTRLGLALAMHSEPELLLIDEVLAVGDRIFQKKAVGAVRELVARGSTVVFVSHDLSLVEEMCDRAIRIERGRLIDEGPTSEVVDRAGGEGWESGVIQITSAIRIEDFTLNPRHVPPGGRLDFSGIIDISDPCPHVRIEFSYLARTDNPNEITAERIASTTVLSRVVAPAGGALSEVGRYRFEGCVPENHLLGECYALVRAIDERDGRMIAQAWQDLKVGSRIQMEILTFPFDISWQVDDTTRPQPSTSGVRS